MRHSPVYGGTQRETGVAPTNPLQQDEGPAGAWVHAYLHRKEGDTSNAAYWYGRAGKPPARVPLDQEWTEITGALLAQKV